MGENNLEAWFSCSVQSVYLSLCTSSWLPPDNIWLSFSILHSMRFPHTSALRFSTGLHCFGDILCTMFLNLYMFKSTLGTISQCFIGFENHRDSYTLYDTEQFHSFNMLLLCTFMLNHILSPTWQLIASFLPLLFFLPKNVMQMESYHYVGNCVLFGLFCFVFLRQDTTVRPRSLNYHSLITHLSSEIAGVCYTHITTKPHVNIRRQRQMDFCELKTNLVY